MDFPTLPYDHIPNLFLLEIWFWGPTYPTFCMMSLFSVFFNSSLTEILDNNILSLCIVDREFMLVNSI